MQEQQHVSCGGTEALVFSIYEKKNKKPSVIVLSIFLALALAVNIPTYHAVVDILPILAFMLYSYGIWQNNLRVTRLFMFVQLSLWVPYAFIARAYTAFIFQVIISTMAFFAIVKFDIVPKIKNEKINKIVKRFMKMLGSKEPVQSEL